LAAYLLVVGLANLTRRPLVLSGTRDLLALGVGLVGIAIIGPIELLTVTQLVIALGPVYWLLVLGLYSSLWLLITLYARPRLVVYQVTTAELLAALERAAQDLDPAARGVGESVLLPEWRVHLILEPFAILRNVSLVAAGERQPPPEFWDDLTAGLRRHLSPVGHGGNGRGMAFIAVAAALFAVLLLEWLSQPQVVARGLLEMLRGGIS